MNLLKSALEQVRYGVLNKRFDLCKKHNDSGVLDTEDCISCPLWHGRMSGGCCNGLFKPAKEAVQNFTVRASKQNRRVAKHRLQTLRDYMKERININETLENL